MEALSGVVGQLAGQGLLGILLVFAGAAIVVQRKELRELGKECREDAKAYIAATGEHRRALEALTATTEARTRAQEEQARAQALTTAELSRVRDELTRIRGGA
jgi:hypothetical protein